MEEIMTDQDRKVRDERVNLRRKLESAKDLSELWKQRAEKLVGELTAERAKVELARAKHATLLEAYQILCAALGKKTVIES
jgi:hypothetical protein